MWKKMQIVRRRRKKSQERNKLGEPPNLKKELEMLCPLQGHELS